jgi:LuxR family maltose regulon positive regulatory protein
MRLGAKLVDGDPTWPFAARELDELDVRIGRGSMRLARRPGVLVEEVTDRELTLGRRLSRTASQHEIRAALPSSINTVKGYAKSRYRKA